MVRVAAQEGVAAVVVVTDIAVQVVVQVKGTRDVVIRVAVVTNVGRIARLLRTRLLRCLVRRVGDTTGTKTRGCGVTRSLWGVKTSRSV